MEVYLRPESLDDYRLFLQIKALPKYSIQGHVAYFPDEYACRLGFESSSGFSLAYEPIDGLFDYQRDIATMAIRKRKFAVFADCGLGKTLIFAEFARHAASSLPAGRCVLIVSPLMVIDQTLAEVAKFYGDDLPIERVKSSDLREWLTTGRHADCRLPNKIGITNYEAMRNEVEPGYLGGLILDESSMLKSHYGKFGQRCLYLGKGLDWKLCCTGTPAPNDRIEYANHAVFLDAFPTINAFLARFFVNRGQTSERWVLKQHALEAFYRALSHWCIFLTNPATYGWKDNCESIPPIRVHQHHVELTPEQIELTQSRTKPGENLELFMRQAGGITSRISCGTIAKGFYKGKRVRSNKLLFIRKLVESWPDESTIIWCLYNEEQKLLEEQFPDAASLKGSTNYEARMKAVNDFKAGRQKVLISKPKILGFGLNLHRATRQVFSGLQDSYEAFYQAVKRSNRIGSTRPLNVHIPITDLEEPMVTNVSAKPR